MSIGLHDVEKLQALYPDYQIELKEGKLIIRSPSDSVSGEIGVRFTMLLGTWVYNHNLGRVLDASTGFRMPNGDLLSPCLLSRLFHESGSSKIRVPISLSFLN